MEINKTVPTSGEYTRWVDFFRFIISDPYTSRPEVQETILNKSWDEPFEFPWNEEEFTDTISPPKIVEKKQTYSLRGIEANVLGELSTLPFDKQNLTDFLSELETSLVADKINPAIADKVYTML